MRLLRELGEEQRARLLADALHGEGIACDVRSDGQVWVHDELDLERASRLADDWLKGAGKEALQAAAQRGKATRAREEEIDAEQRRAMARAQRAFETARAPRPTPVTYGLIIASTIVFVAVQQAEQAQSAVRALWIQDPAAIPVHVLQLGALRFRWLGLPLSEPWRLVTPILLHMGFMHILFNMLWLHGLGGALERRHGSGYVLAFVLLSGVLSNILQYEVGQSPAFGGMSGVVYGMLGLVWVRGRLDPFAGYAISSFTVNFMLLWLVLGFVAPGMRSANWCHLGGLAVGCAWGALAARRRR